MNSFDFFTHAQITDRLYHITESYAPCRDPGFDNGSIFNIYVIIGDDKVAVVDTGLGAVDGLRRYIEHNIVRGKPMIALLGHTHPDHCGAATLFDEVYFHPAELPDLDWNSNIDRRMSDLLLFANYKRDVLDFCSEHHVKARITEDYPHTLIEDGDVIDLGGIKLKVLHLPGHSPGSLVFWNEDEHWACGSDSVQILNNYRGDLDTLRYYHACIERLIKILPEDIKIYSGHDTVVHDKCTLYLMRESLEDIIGNRNLEHDIPKPPRFAMTKPGPKVMIHRFGRIRSSYSSELWNNYKEGTELTAEEFLALLKL